MLNMPLLSVVVPVYNIKEFLPECVDSIINQTYTDFELILVDDGSTDGSGEMCDDYIKRDSRITVIHKKNGGLVSARKAGLSVVQGKYIANIDGDDWIDRRMFSILMELLQKENTDFVQCGFCRESNEKKRESCVVQTRTELDDPTPIMTDWLRSETEKKMDSQIFTKILRTDLFIRAYTRVPDHMNNGEDYIFFVELMKDAGSYAVSDEVFYHYRVREDSLSHKKSFQRAVNEQYLSAYVWHRIRMLFPDFPLSELNRWFFRRAVSIDKSLLLQDVRGTFIPVFRFPKSVFPLGKTIAIYGAGSVGKEYYLQVSRYHEIRVAAWVDKGYKTITNDYMKVESPEILRTLHFDLVMAAVKRRDMFEVIRQELEELGVPEDRIVWTEPETIGENPDEFI